MNCHTTAPTFAINSERLLGSPAVRWSVTSVTALKVGVVAFYGQAEPYPVWGSKFSRSVAVDQGVQFHFFLLQDADPING
jgi:hypothetical protein